MVLVLKAAPVERPSADQLDGIGVLSTAAGRVLDDDSPLRVIAKAIGESSGKLMDQGCCPSSWSRPGLPAVVGTRVEMVDRIVRERPTIRELSRLSHVGGSIGWADAAPAAG